MRSDARKRMDSERLSHYDPSVRELIRAAQEKAWDEGYGDDATCNEPRTNPYRSAS